MIFICVCMCVCMCMCVRVCMCVYIYIPNMCVYMCVCVDLLDSLRHIRSSLAREHSPHTPVGTNKPAHSSSSCLTYK